jgi:hypothetical protein
MERRDFLNNLARGSILIGLSLMSGILLFKKNEAPDCDFQFICSKCKQLTECKLPEAAKYKEINSLK